MKRVQNTVSLAWKSEDAKNYRTGVSLHSHTSISEESLTFIHKMFAAMPVLKPVFHFYERKAEAAGFKLDFERAHWRPPLTPGMAYELERNQINKLGLKALVSLSDHDAIDAPMLLRVMESNRSIPVSSEWSVPFGVTEFHMGVHNLPASCADEWHWRMEQYRAAPGDEALRTLLHDLDAQPGVLLVLNHPLWDLYAVGEDRHLRELHRFLAVAGRTIHALELNGLRHQDENLGAVELAKQYGQVLISGGDRHSLEPNAMINLTEARTFREFVDEVRIERRSHVLVMPQYRRPWHARMMYSTLDAVTDFPEFPAGWRGWDERAFHPDADGKMRTLRELWGEGGAPLPLRAAIQFVRLGRSETFAEVFAKVMGGGEAAGELAGADGL